MNHKQRVQYALEKFYKKQEQQQAPRESKRKYHRPEKDTEAQVLAWAKANGFHLHIVDSGSYDPRTRQRVGSKAQRGFPDLCGNSETGLSVWIELKAKDKRNTTSAHQRIFLERKISQNCFAVVVDSASRLEQYWRGFCRLTCEDARRDYLLECLPKLRETLDLKELF